MPRYAGFLRGINVSGRRAGKDELRSCFEAMGYRDVSTFRASGNVIFAADNQPVAGVTARIEEGLTRSLGYQVVTFLRVQYEVRAIADHEPFSPADVRASKGKLQVMLLSRKPGARAREDVLALTTAEDKLAFGDRELYWLPSAGTQDSSLSRTLIETLLGPTTMRTKGTIDQIAQKHFAA